MKIDDRRLTGWVFECTVDSSGMPPQGGLVLRNLTHDIHHFAEDVRCVGMWIETEEVEPSGEVVPGTVRRDFQALESPTFTFSAAKTFATNPTSHPPTVSTFEYLKASDASLQFSTYFKGSGAVMTGISALYSAPLFFKDRYRNCHYDGLQVEQIFLFSGRSRTPPHEPSGTIWAARFHPMIRYQVLPKPDHDPKARYTRLNSIRFDYRLHLTLDSSLDESRPSPQATGNSAGVFADKDSVAKTAIDGAIFGILKRPAGSAVTSGIFESMEKPLVLEVTAPGLGRGFSQPTTKDPAGKDVNIRCWDNLHWWGTRQPMISAPGAFHAAHMHWRWGAASAASPEGSNPAFNPDTYPSGMLVPAGMAGTFGKYGVWGPLVDPGIFMQTIQVAVVKNIPQLDPARGAPLKDLSTKDWSSLFKQIPGSPNDISKAPTDIVLWYSAEVHQDVKVFGTRHGDQVVPRLRAPRPQTFRAKLSGTVFIHGMFFAHEPEAPGLSVGTTGKEYKPRSEKEIETARSLFRPAS